ncbi:leucine-rich repeat and fibronectin type-III domain-containing protein 4-like [Pollicipes pollicipes]|uniref:leucine-rich repeat and fibronectin type-III domain-containing protein 4-like n=1 Tax=Pollicipes pollicipes TaxID=41117 RepID=UPI0018852ADD|nr:leucine-rich repeat and fibronectin type-III domain-containing protein 4-like [Pollicipes pollicipes]
MAAHRWALRLLAMSLATSVAADCPAVCECRWKGGKQTVECADEGLLTIPGHMDASTQVLDVSGNNIQIVPVQKFQRMGLTNLQRVYMARCKIEEVDDHALLGLTNLVELDLSDNFLTAVPGRTFSDTPSLMRLSLSGNPIRRLSRASFASLKELTTLELSRCELDTIEPGVFAALGRLEWLRLDGNRLTQLDAEGLSLDLHGVDLHDNPWQCDCHLRSLRRWLVLYRVPPAVAPQCAAPPRLAGRVIRDAAERQLACLPDVSPPSMELKVPEDHNVTLNCRVRAEPPANVTWSFNGQPLGDSGALFYRPYSISEYSEDGGRLRRSQLLVVNATDADQGVFRCSASNEAGVSDSNYTLRVLLPPGSSSSESAPPARASYVAAVGASLIFLVVLLVILGYPAEFGLPRGGTMGRSRSYHQQLGGAGDGIWRIPQPAAPPTPARLQRAVTRRRRGDPNTSGLPDGLPPPPPPPPPPACGPVNKFSDHVTAAHSSLHESPDEGYEESAADGTEV